MRSFMGCTKVSGPVRAEILINIRGEVKASAFLVCPWETANSEIKVCVFLTGLLGVFLALRALGTESRKGADLYIQISYFFCFLLLFTSVFDFFAVAAAQQNNQDVCTLTGTFAVAEGIKNEKLECTYWLFSLTGYYGVFCATLILASNYLMKQWKSELVEDLD